MRPGTTARFMRRCTVPSTEVLLYLYLHFRPKGTIDAHSRVWVVDFRDASMRISIHYSSHPSIIHRMVPGSTPCHMLAQYPVQCPVIHERDSEREKKGGRGSEETRLSSMLARCYGTAQLAQTIHQWPFSDTATPDPNQLPHHRRWRWDCTK